MDSSVKIPKSISLFDFSHALNVAFNALGPDQAGSIVLEQLASLRTACEHVVICLDTKPYWRATVFDGYKAGRRQEPELTQIWDRTMQRVVDAGYNLARAAGEEADDVMATLACIYAEEYACDDVRLVTADKDVAQLLNSRVRWFVPQLGKRDEFEIRDAAWVPRRFGGVDWENEKVQKVGPLPSEVPLCQAICGDTSDKIPGVKGIGIKGAVALIKTYGTLEAMAQGLVAESNAAKMKGKELAKFWQNYAEGMGSIPKWLKLTTLKHDVELDAHPLKYLERLMPKATEPDDEEVPEFLDETLDESEPTAEELEAERLVMAASLPVDPAPVEQRSAADRQVAAARAMAVDHVVAEHPTVPRESAESMVNAQHNAQHAPRVGKAPDADAVLEQAAAERERLRIEKLAAEARERVATGQTDPKTGKPPIPKDAPAAAQQTAPGGPAATGDAPSQVVSPRQGPQKPRGEDELIENVSAIVPFAAPSWELSTQPATAGHAFAIAKRLHASKRWLSKYENAESLAAVILRGREMGIGMLTALDAFYVIKGKVCTSSQLLAALAERDANHEYTMMLELDAKHAVVEIKHKKHPAGTRWTYTIGQAEALGLLKPSPKTGEPSQWVKRPETMLLKTARANGHRFMFPGATLGMHSIETEVDAQHLVGDGDE